MNQLANWGHGDYIKIHDYEINHLYRTIDQILEISLKIPPSEVWIDWNIEGKDVHRYVLNYF